MPVEHSVRFRVRFAETDAMQVAYYAEYFVWFEVARNELFRSLAFPYEEVRRRGYHTPVAKAVAEYKASARYDDEIEVSARVTKVGTSSFRLDYVVRKVRGRATLCVGHTVHVFVGEDGRPRPIPKDLRDRISP